MRKYIFTLIFLLTVLNLSFGQTEKSLTGNPPKLTEYITDEAGTLKTDEINSLKSNQTVIQDFQVAVVIREEEEQAGITNL